jgi:hypothetical protein
MYPLPTRMARSPLLLAVVVGLHVVDSWLVSRRWLRPGADRAWGIVLLTFLQWGTLSTILSLAQALTPAGWLAGLTVMTAAALTAGRKSDPAWPAPSRVEHRPVVARAAGLAVLALVLGAAFVVQWRIPLHKGDDLMYHGARAAHWLQHRSLLPYPTHNDRQNVFTAAADLPFLIGLLFTRDERVARLLHLTALPLAVWGTFALGRKLGARGGAALIGPLLFATTPLVVASAEGIGAELWTAVGLLGFLYYLVRVLRRPRARDSLAWFGLGAFTSLSLAFKLTLLPVPGLVGVATIVAGGPPLWPRLRALAGGLLVAAVGSGLVLTLAGNAWMYGHLLGPADMQRVHRSDLRRATVRAHLARMPFLVAGVPALWSDGARDSIQDAADWLADRTGATATLRGERREGWPGAFQPRIPRLDERFSLTAIFGLAAAAWTVVQWGRRRGRPYALRWPPGWIVFVTAILGLAIVLFLRWQTAAGLPDRFLVPLLAPAGAVVAYVVFALRRHTCAIAAFVVLFAWSLVPGVVQLTRATARAIAEPARPPGRVGLFADAAASLPEGARVLLVSDQSSGDYVLFAPERGFSNVVLPWGQGPFDAAVLRDRLARERPTHVLIQNAEAVDFHWGGTLRTREMVGAVEGLPGARRIPLPDPGMRLFALD